jgi:DNA mismatch repair ATPase MutS
MNEDKLMVKCYIDFHNVYVKKFGKNKMTVLMQVGSFYEVYNTGTEGPNLEELEEITDVSIAHKGRDKTKVNVNNPLMWGFPMVATDKYIGLLIENGYTLVIVDQITQKPNIKREVVSILSPSTYLEQVFKPSSNNIVNVYIEEIDSIKIKI